MIRGIFDFFEKRAFGVCAWWGRKLGLPVNKVRVWFIYLSFIAVGSPILLYLIMAFVLENKHVFKFWNWGKRKTIWDL